MGAQNNECVIFYSWQSDIRIVKNCIYKALTSINGRDSGLDVKIDHDTSGLSGAPRIEDAIIDKIRRCDLFVADVTIINPNYEGRKVCNPNVLLELGVAIASLGWDRIMLLSCEDYGSVDELPFDFNHNRIASFSVEDKESAKKQIQSKVRSSIRILQSKGLIHGGSPQVLDAKRWLYSMLIRALENILKDNPVVMLVSALDRLDSLEGSIERDCFDCLHSLLSMLVSIFASPDEKEFYAVRIAETCFEPIYLEYRNYFPALEIAEVLKQPIYDALNSLLPVQSQKPFSDCRYREGKLVFSTNPERLLAYSAKGELLLSGRLNENDHFCGFQIAKIASGVYVGCFEDGLRTGEGIMYTDLVRNDFRYPACCGSWKNDEIETGMIYSTHSYFGWKHEIPDRGLPAREFLANGTMLHGWLPDVEAGLCPVYDVRVENGVGRVAEETFERYPEEIFADKGVLLNTYFRRMSGYDVPLNAITSIGDPIGIDYDSMQRTFDPFF